MSGFETAMIELESAYLSFIECLEEETKGYEKACAHIDEYLSNEHESPQ